MIWNLMKNKIIHIKKHIQELYRLDIAILIWLKNRNYPFKLVYYQLLQQQHYIWYDYDPLKL